MELALQNDCKVTAVCFEFANWSKNLNEQIKARLFSKITYYGIPGNRKPFFPWLISSVCFSISKTLLNIFPKNVLLLSLASNKRSWLLLKEMKKINEKFDLMIAHNPGSFYPALVFAKKNRIPFGIDLEDYHPGETNNKKEIRHAKNLNRAILPKANYITAASSLILEYSEADLSMPLKNKQTILNYFPSTEFIEPAPVNSEKLRLVWFSQNISFGRGLEQLVEAIKNNEHVEMHLFGNCDQKFREQWINENKNIVLHDSIPQTELHQQLARYDVGLAIEPGKDLNNELALSNKILAYFQSGLYILASDTKAQQRFMEEHPVHGILTTLPFDELKLTIQRLADQMQVIRTFSPERFEKAKKFNWENESGRLLKIWDELITGQAARSGLTR